MRQKLDCRSTFGFLREIPRVVASCNRKHLDSESRRLLKFGKYYSELYASSLTGPWILSVVILISRISISLEI